MICFICGKEFEVIRKHGGSNREICYDCMPEGLSKSERATVRQKLFRTKAQADKLKRGCDRCGYNKYPQVLEWHHDGDDKSFNPSDKLKHGTKPAYLEYVKETEKCSLLCANCHREVHIELGDI